MQSPSSSSDVGTDVALDRATNVSFDVVRHAHLQYDTRIFNRFSNQIFSQSKIFAGQTYGQVQQNFNESNAREAGLEVSIARTPRTGFGFHVSGDLTRAYVYNVNTNTNGNAAGPYTYLVDGAQLGGYPFSFGFTGYGQWNAFHEPGFGVFDSSIALPVNYGFTLRLGGTNLFNHDNYRTFSVYNYGYATDQGGAYFPTTLLYYQPRTLFLQLERKVGSR